MRNISFSLTTPQFLDGSKDVTRRVGWLFLKQGEQLCAVEKSQGLGKGGKIKRLGIIRVVSLRCERLDRLLADIGYGLGECIREGFAAPHENNRPEVFVPFFCRSHKGCRPSTVITRIEFVREAA